MMPEVDSFTVFAYFTFIFFAAIVLRYFIAAGIFYWYFYRYRYSLYKDKKLNRNDIPNNKQLQKEIKWSIITSAIFAAIAAFTIWLYQNDYTAIYTAPEKHGYWFLPVSLAIAMFFHETYYYWVHRWMHHPEIFKVVHKVHHDSLVTSPWTAFSFHPLEGFLEAIIIPLILIFLPMNIYVLGVYLLIMTISSIVNHLDIEVYPKWLQQHWLGKGLIGATHHYYHHKEFKSNYGLYFTFWDKWMNTESKAYKKHN